MNHPNRERMELCAAAAAGNAAAVSRLLRMLPAGANVNAIAVADSTFGHPETPLGACAAGASKAVERAQSDDPFEPHHSAAGVAARLGHTSIVSAESCSLG